MKLFERTLDTILEAGTVPPQSNPADVEPSTGVFSNSMTPSMMGAAAPQADPAGATKTYNGPTPANNNQMGTVQQWQEVEKMREQAKAQKLGAMSVDQKIDLALKQSEQAEKVAYRTSAAVSSLDSKLDRVFQNLSGMIQRVGSGKPAKEPDPPGSSIFDDEDDPESIFGR